MSNEQSDLTTRVKSFNEELIALLGKYKLGLGATPLMNGNPVNDAFREMYNIQARPQVFDDVKPEETKVEPAPAEAEAGTKEPGIAAA